MAKGVGVGVGEGGACKYSGERWAQRGGGGGGGGYGRVDVQMQKLYQECQEENDHMKKNEEQW